jgi:membrane associated rhomboid family serine protease
MVATAFVLLILGGVAFRAMNSEERMRALRWVVAAIRQLRDAALYRPPECERFREVLRARTPWVLVTPALVALNATVFLFMLFGAGALSDPTTLVAWGGNLGPRTTNGEWWRLVTSTFIHSGGLPLLVNGAALVQIGLLLERLLGGVVVAAVYVAAGVFASLVSLNGHPMAVSAGASGAVFGLYGLLLASSIWSLFRRSSVTIPLRAATRLAPAAAMFILYNAGAGGLEGVAELSGLVAGFVCGLVLTRDVADRKPPTRRIAVAMAVTLSIAAASAIPLHGITDVRPEVQRVIALEGRTAGTYRTAADQFIKGRITAAALAQLIERAIVPELQAAGARLEVLHGVPREDQPLVADAEEYLRLRSESWRLRVEELRKAGTVAPRDAKRMDQASDANWRLRAESEHRANIRTLGKAEGMERASLEALQRIKAPGQK